MRESSLNVNAQIMREADHNSRLRPGVLRSVAAKGGKAAGTRRLVTADGDREPLKQHVSLLHSAKPLARHRQPGVNGSPSPPREGREVAQGRADAYHTAVS
ncbi:unnamed protein product [Pleuronectes platessa]|uniref:Uncharacterized protein n=1 Tax=Pleuronectes platessa TaxID=8262 RepID=A0A9N7V5C2_PLEPL|nr:unnamed protein product [Pleuronectes platessa]